ncbi:hypothetical protein [Sorangium atrum]|uniref:Uncharacterized protein n=1 Tax=Sorangium atrum TaxID=2995308 RepID=A0ABT5C7W5_9BACT|nr:hypothetical protein [Sorangium aterium]MDC0681247.1 hypothetical protein [Sorangium aterium]
MLPRTTSQLVEGGKLTEERPQVIVLVVDDADTAEAAQLRERVAQSMRASLLAVIESRWGTCGSADPAQWHPGDIRVVVARPSAPDAAALLTSREIPALAWITQTSHEEEVEAVMAGVTEALGQRLAEPGEEYRPLRTARRALELVTGALAPVGEAEVALVRSLPQDRLARLLVASTRDDEGPGLIADEVPSQTALSMTLDTEVVGPFTTPDWTCRTVDRGSTRLEAWSELVRAEPITSRCDDQDTWDMLLHPGWADCGFICQAHPLAVDAGGVVACNVMIDQADLERCDAARGQRDPGGQPTFVERGGAELRRCEVVQLAGADLESCRHSLDCPGCPSGFCATEVPELVSQWSCERSDHPWPLRFIGGAIEGRRGWINITCSTEAGE